ncbi:MAG: hypothetical protein KY455_13975 [Euryarchaeota archaeon]|nr:hypothetical protein [Euryarchaeota archaeon]
MVKAVAPPETVEWSCPTCREETEQKVLKGKVVKKGLGVEGTFECLQCGSVQSSLVTWPSPVPISMIVSKEAESYPAGVEVLEGEGISVGDEFEVEDTLVEITGIELKDQGRRVEKAFAEEVATLWAKSIDQVRVKFAVNVGPVTRSYEAWFGPEEEISVGEPFELGDERAVVDRILTTEGRRYMGTYNVRDIKRVWLRSPSRQRPLHGGGPPNAERGGRPEGRPVGARTGQGRSRPSSGRTGGGPWTGEQRQERPPGARPRSGDDERPRSGGPRSGGRNDTRPGQGRPSSGTRSSGRPRTGGAKGRPGAGGRPSTGRSSPPRAPRAPRSGGTGPSQKGRGRPSKDRRGSRP